MALKDKIKSCSICFNRQLGYNQAMEKFKSCIEAIKQEVINDNTTENFEFIKKSRVKEIIDKAMGFEEKKEEVKK